MPLLEKMLGADETVVREKSIETFIKIVSKLDKAELNNAVTPFLSKILASNAFGSKMSSLNILAELFQLFDNDKKQQLIEKMNALFTEESLILRRNLARTLGRLCKYLPKDLLLSEIQNHFKNLANDDSEQVRIITIESLVELAKVFTPDENKTYLIPMVIQLTSDKSWRVRVHLAKSFGLLAAAVGSEISENQLLSIFSTLIRDLENEVRVASVRSLYAFVNFLSLEKVTQVLAYLQTLAKDSVPLVRTGAGEVLQALLKLEIEQLGPEVTKNRV